MKLVIYVWYCSMMLAVRVYALWLKARLAIILTWITLKQMWLGAWNAYYQMKLDKYIRERDEAQRELIRVASIQREAGVVSSVNNLEDRE